MKLIVLASGSKANAAIIENNGSAVLVDCGVTLKTIINSLADNGLKLTDICAVLVTHCHSDHVKGLGVLRKKTSVPFFSAIDIDGCCRLTDSTHIAGFSVTSFECSHDVPCCGYRISCGDRSISIVTDTGTVTDAMICAMSGCGTVMLESNHDIDMLKNGNYPAELKKRILSNNGHLSNAECAKAVALLSQSGLKRVVLAHLSEHNNSPLIARSDVGAYLKKAGVCEVDIVTAQPGLTVEI